MSTPGARRNCLAAEATRDGDTLPFTGGNPWSHHETRTAAVIDRKDYEYIRLRWSEDEYRDTYLELRMEKSDITGDYILVITDYAPDGDTATLEDIWDANMDALHRSTGL